MKKRSSSSSLLSSSSLAIPHITTLNTVVDSSASSPSSSSSSSSSSSCVVDYDDHNQNVNNGKINEQNDEDVKPPKAKKTRKKRVLVHNKNEENCPNVNTNKRSSIYRGVTRHRWTGRYEAHLWDKSSWNNMQNKKGKQVYLGAYDSEVDAARTYDLAALKYWGPETTLNFGIDNYTKDIEEMKNVSKEEYLASLRRRSSGFSRGVSKYRGVARHHHNGRWEARIGRVFGNKYLYLGTFSSQEEAAAAYDMAAIEYRGANAVTNFDISNYIGLVKNLTPTDPSQSPNPSEKKPKPKQKQQKQQRHSIKPAKQEEQCEKEIQHHHEQQEQEQQEEMVIMPSDFEESKLISPIDHSSLLEMAGDDANGENPWSFCLDNGEFDPLLFPDIPLPEDGRFLNMFEQTSFEDNIDLIFEDEGLSISMDDIYSDGIDEVGCQMETTAPTDLDKKMENSVSSSSSFPPSPTSTTSLVSCQVSH